MKYNQFYLQIKQYQSGWHTAQNPPPPSLLIKGERLDFFKIDGNGGAGGGGLKIFAKKDGGGKAK